MTGILVALLWGFILGALVVFAVQKASRRADADVAQMVADRKTELPNPDHYDYALHAFDQITQEY